MRRCIVTGATRGIGHAICEALAGEYDIVGLARTRPKGWAGDFIECDLSSFAGIEHACAAISSYDHVWGLVNNAGIGAADSIGEIRLETLQQVFTINAFAPAMLASSVSMRMNDGGRIMNVCSSAMLGKPERTAYGSSKAALASMTRTWALELAPRGITVNAVSPGPIETELFRDRNPKGSPGEQSALAASPMHRLGTPAQVAALVRLLMDPCADYTTGQIVGVDGGISAGPSSLL